MEIKPRPNHRIYIQTLRGMTPKPLHQKAFELSALTKALFDALRKRFVDKTDAEIKAIYLERIEKCHNRNY